ncbi:nitroreductase family protein [Clostridium fungisolvens]|uniref:Nitroreductase domain-containing protein n=1 Tax=Clostridium fungisolvens TaxID=1604897 RepID=A0A6V8SJU2_9CLOT|nr:nitroreductase family protein [Clostridium fungisolvens]GFP75428.1 hypothetical protein bsdtw1_01508 [Clostridium fungisolvens]
MLLEQLKTRRSIRKYEHKEVEKEKIDIILKSALLAPSSMSRKPLQFIAVTDAELLQKLSLCREPGPRYLADAPLAIIVIADNTASDVWVEDASIAATFMQLTAHDLGLGSCWIQVRKRFRTEQETAEQYIKELMEIPEQYSVQCILSIGYPGEEKKPYEEGALKYEKLHFNKF